jgi:hypothetical protein
VPDHELESDDSDVNQIFLDSNFPHLHYVQPHNSVVKRELPAIESYKGSNSTACNFHQADPSNPFR